jgi:hypothetical protein
MLRIVLPAIGISALGCVYVWGLSFVPAPATGIIAFIDHFFDGLTHIAWLTAIVSVEYSIKRGGRKYRFLMQTVQLLLLSGTGLFLRRDGSEVVPYAEDRKNILCKETSKYLTLFRKNWPASETV